MVLPAKKKNFLVATLFVCALCLGSILRAERDILKFLPETLRTIDPIDSLTAFTSVSKEPEVKLDSVNEWISYEDRMEQFNWHLSSIDDSSLTTTDTALLTEEESPFGNLTTELFTVSQDGPFNRCFPAEYLPHPLVYVENHPAHTINTRGKEPFRNGRDPISTCSGLQFTEIVVEDNGQRISNQAVPLPDDHSRPIILLSKTCHKTWINSRFCQASQAVPILSGVRSAPRLPNC